MHENLYLVQIGNFYINNKPYVFWPVRVVDGAKNEEDAVFQTFESLKKQHKTSEIIGSPSCVKSGTHDIKIIRYQYNYVVYLKNKAIYNFQECKIIKALPFNLLYERHRKKIQNGV